MPSIKITAFGEEHFINTNDISPERHKAINETADTVTVRNGKGDLVTISGKDFGLKQLLLVTQTGQDVATDIQKIGATLKERAAGTFKKLLKLAPSIQGGAGIGGLGGFGGAAIGAPVITPEQAAAGRERLEQEIVDPVVEAAQEQKRTLGSLAPLAEAAVQTGATIAEEILTDPFKGIGLAGEIPAKAVGKKLLREGIELAEKELTQFGLQAAKNEAIGNAIAGGFQASLEEGATPASIAQGTVAGAAIGGLLGAGAAKARIAKDARTGRSPELTAFFDAKKEPEALRVLHELRDIIPDRTDEMIIADFTLWRNGPKLKGESFKSYMKSVVFRKAETGEIPIPAVDQVRARMSLDKEAPLQGDPIAPNPFSEISPDSFERILGIEKAPEDIVTLKDFADAVIPDKKRAKAVVKEVERVVKQASDQGIEFPARIPIEETGLATIPTQAAADLLDIPIRVGKVEYIFDPATGDLILKRTPITPSRTSPDIVVPSRVRAALPEARFETQPTPTGGIPERGFPGEEVLDPTDIAPDIERFPKAGRIRLTAADRFGVEPDVGLDPTDVGGIPALRQQSGDKTKGQVDFRDPSQTIVTAFQDADPSTIPHEMAHIFRRRLPEGARNLSDKVYTEGTGNWTREAEEAFADDYLFFQSQGIAPNRRLDPVFKIYSKYLTDIYKDLKASPFSEKIPDQTRLMFETMLDPRRRGEKFNFQPALNVLETTGRSGEVLFQNDKGEKLPWGDIDVPTEVKRATEKPTRTSEQQLTDINKATDDMINETSSFYDGEGVSKIGQIGERLNDFLFDYQGRLKRYDTNGELVRKAETNLLSRSKALNMATTDMKAAFEPAWTKNRLGLRVPRRTTWGGRTKVLLGDVAKDVAFERVVDVRRKKGQEIGDEDLRKLAKIKKNRTELRRTTEGAESERRAVEISDNLNAMSRKILQYWLDNDMIIQADFDRMVNANPFHLPLYRELEKTGAISQALGGRTLKKAKGSKKKIKDPVENLMGNYLNMIPYVDQLVLTRNALDAAGRVGAAKFEKIIQPELRVTIDSETGLRQVFTPRRSLNDNQQMVKRGDKWELWTINDPLLARMFKVEPNPKVSLDAWLSGTRSTSDLIKSGFVSVAKPAKELFRKGITVTSKFIGANAMRDFQTLLRNDPDMIYKMSSRTPEELKKFAIDIPKFPLRALKTLAVDYPRSFITIATNEHPSIRRALEIMIRQDYDPALYNELVKQGAVQASQFSATPAGVQGIVDEATGANRLDIRKPGKAAITLAIAPFKAAYGFVDHIAGIIEQTPRLIAADKVFQKTGDMELALAPFANSTANFAKKGYVGRGALGSTTPFFTASLAGTKAEIDSFNKNREGNTVKMAYYAALAMALYMRNKDDPRYQGLSTSDKNRYFYLGWVGDTPIRINRDYGIISTATSAMPERIIDIISKEDPDALNSIMQTLADTFPALPIPALVKTGAALVAGKDLHFGTKFEGPFDDKKPVYQRFKPSTSELSKYVTKKANFVFNGVTPSMLDFIIRDTTGTLGIGIANVVGDIIVRLNGGVPPSKTIEKTPFINILAQTNPLKTLHSDHIQNFFNNAKVMGQVKSELNTLEADGDIDEWQRIAGERGWAALAWEEGYTDPATGQTFGIKDIDKEIKELRREYRLLEDPFRWKKVSPNLTPQERRMMMDTIAVQMNAYAIFANQIFQDAKSEFAR